MIALSLSSKLVSSVDFSCSCEYNSLTLCGSTASLSPAVFALRRAAELEALADSWSFLEVVGAKTWFELPFICCLAEIKLDYCCMPLFDENPPLPLLAVDRAAVGLGIGGFC